MKTKQWEKTPIGTALTWKGFSGKTIDIKISNTETIQIEYIEGNEWLKEDVGRILLLPEVMGEVWGIAEYRKAPERIQKLIRQGVGKWKD